MTIKKISILMTLLVTVLFSACDTEQEGAIYVPDNAGVSFTASNLGSFTVPPTEPTVAIELFRGNTTGEYSGTVSVSAVSGRVPLEGVTASGFTFADGEAQTTVTVNGGVLAIGQTATVTLTLDDADNVSIGGTASTSFNISMDYTWNSLGEATFYDNQFFYWYNDGNGVQVEMFQAAEAPQRYKLADPYAEFNAANWPASELDGFTKATTGGDFIFIVQDDGSIVYDSYAIGMNYTGYGEITIEYPADFGLPTSYNRQLDDRTWQLAPMFYMAESGAGFNCSAIEGVVIIQLP